MRKGKHTGFRVCVLLSYFFSFVFWVIAIIGLIFDVDNRITWILMIVIDCAICLPGSRQIREQYKKITSSSDNASN